MALPQSPADFDLLDATLNLERPARRRARRVAQVRAHPLGRRARRNRRIRDKGYWLVTKHADVKEVSKRNDVFGSSPDGAIPTWPQEMNARAIDLQKRRPAQHGRAAAHPAAQDHLPRLHPARRRTA